MWSGAWQLRQNARGSAAYATLHWRLDYLLMSDTIGAGLGLAGAGRAAYVTTLASGTLTAPP